MKVATLLLIIADVIPILDADGLIDDNGDFVSLTANQIVKIVNDVNNALLARGITEPAQIAQVLALLPLVLSLAGVK